MLTTVTVQGLCSAGSGSSSEDWGWPLHYKKFRFSVLQLCYLQVCLYTAIYTHAALTAKYTPLTQHVVATDVSILLSQGCKRYMQPHVAHLYSYMNMWVYTCVCGHTNKPVYIISAILAWSFNLAKYTVYLGCNSTQFRCSNGQCVTSSFRCNGRTGGCSDGSDEKNCSKFLNHLSPSAA